MIAGCVAELEASIKDVWPLLGSYYSGWWGETQWEVGVYDRRVTAKIDGVITTCVCQSMADAEALAAYLNKAYEEH